jgi:site-specific DNA-methyltransferase (adenine-specific)
MGNDYPDAVFTTEHEANRHCEMTSQSFLDGRVTLHGGDSRDILKKLPDASIDSVVTDPPYALVSIGKRFGKAGSAPAQHGKDGLYARASAGFMGQQWDTGETAFAEEFWAEVLRVLKPGGHVVAFSGTRTYHRMACAIEDAGFEIRDQLAWTYGSGFPKSHSMRQIGRPELGTALKPAWEPICLARKPLIGTVAENVLHHGTGALNIDGCRVGTEGGTRKEASADKSTTDSVGGYLNAKAGAPIDAGRWPANIVHDGSDEVVACFPETSSGTFAASHADSGKSAGILGAMSGRNRDRDFIGSSGSAARYFYSAKADANDRLGSKHPTVKPVDLMQWLVRLITPKGGLVLDPFAGTGTTGEAAWREGMRAVLIEREAQYQADIAKRMELAVAGTATRKGAIAKAKPPGAPLPLFANDNEIAKAA